MKSINKYWPHQRDGQIEEVQSTSGHIEFKFQCEAVEGGELTVSINPHTNGRLYIHFSGLGSKMVKPSQVCANGVDINIVDC